MVTTHNGGILAQHQQIQLQGIFYSYYTEEDAQEQTHGLG